MGALSVQPKQEWDKKVLSTKQDVQDKIQTGCKGREEKKLWSSRCQCNKPQQ